MTENVSFFIYEGENMTKLAEALILRADTQKRFEQLKARLLRNAKVQEGERPSENPQELLVELERVADHLTALIQQINRTNSQTELGNSRSLSDGLAERDVLKMKHSTYSALAQSAAEMKFRYGRSEVKILSAVDVAEVQKQADAYARQYRELDAQIQGLNWQTDLAE